jgi:hypothetical protein
MPVALRFELIREIVAHGARVGSDDSVDPSTSAILSQAGTAMVTTYLEQLALLDIICDPHPIFGAKGGMWIAYRLTEKGLKLSKPEGDLRGAVVDLTGDARSEVSQAVRSLLDECQSKEINENYKLEFLRTIEEIAICFDDECYIAAIGLCGKVLEVVLKEILLRHGVNFDSNMMVGTLIKLIRERVSGEYLDPSIGNVINIVNTSRITAVQANERIPIPSRDQAIMVIHATRDVVRRNLSHYRGSN